MRQLSPGADTHSWSASPFSLSRQGLAVGFDAALGVAMMTPP
jgi:hypothetical protein